jgi:hypothetical protein
MFRNRCRLIAESNPGPWTMRVGCDLRSTSGPGALCRGSKYRQLSSSMRHSLVIAPGSCLHRNRYRRRSPEPPKLNRITTKRAAMVSLQCREPNPPMSQMGQTRRFRDVRSMSGLHLSSDVSEPGRHVALGPSTEVAGKPIAAMRRLWVSSDDAPAHGAGTTCASPRRAAVSASATQASGVAALQGQTYPTSRTAVW